MNITIASGESWQTHASCMCVNWPVVISGHCSCSLQVEQQPCSGITFQRSGNPVSLLNESHRPLVREKPQTDGWKLRFVCIIDYNWRGIGARESCDLECCLHVKQWPPNFHNGKLHPQPAPVEEKRAVLTGSGNSRTWHSHRRKEINSMQMLGNKLWME